MPMQDRKQLCDKVIKLDRTIRFAGIVNDKGEVVQGGFQQGVQPLLDGTDEQQMYIQSLAYVSALASYKDKLGAVKFNMTEHEKVSLLTFPLDDGTLLCISSNSKSNAEKLKTRVFQVIKDSRSKTGLRNSKSIK